MRRIFKLFLDAYWRFNAQDGWAIASHIALSTLTSLFPFLIFVTAMAGFVGSQNLADEVANLIFSVWPAVVANPIANEVHDVLATPRGGLLTIGAVLALYFSSGAIEAARIGLNRAYGMVETRPWWLLRLESIAYVIVRRHRAARARFPRRAVAADLGERAELRACARAAASCCHVCPARNRLVAYGVFTVHCPSLVAQGA